MTVPGGGCHSLGCCGYLCALLEAHISLGTTTRFHVHLPQAHLLVMSLIVTVMLCFSCEVIRDQQTGESLQYAFIEFENVSMAP